MMKTILLDAINTFVIKEKGIFTKMHQLLEQYPNKKIILTSANDKQMHTHGLYEVPYELFTLKHNPEKSNPEYYKKMLAHYTLQAKDVIYFEHNMDAVKTAQSVGIITHYYDKETKDLEKLKEFLDENL